MRRERENLDRMRRNFLSTTNQECEPELAVFATTVFVNQPEELSWLDGLLSRRVSSLSGAGETSPCGQGPRPDIRLA